jgi:hypothetical protein
MSGDDGPLLWRYGAVDLGKWLPREKAVLYGINLIMLAIFRDSLGSGAYKNLRTSEPQKISYHRYV